MLWIQSQPTQKAWFFGSNLTGLFFFLSLFFRATYGGSQAWGLIGAVASDLHHSISNSISEPRLRLTPQLTAKPDPQPTEQGQGSNQDLYGYQSGLLTAEPWRELWQVYSLLFKTVKEVKRTFTKKTTNWDELQWHISRLIKIQYLEQYNPVLDK